MRGRSRINVNSRQVKLGDTAALSSTSCLFPVFLFYLWLVAGACWGR